MTCIGWPSTRHAANRRGDVQVNEQQLPLNISNRWFEKRRDYFLRQLVENFFRVHLAFQETYFIYMECRRPGAVDCSELLESERAEKRQQLWDRLVRLVGSENDKGPLWQIKDLCHMLWPEIESDQDISGSLLDWLIGSIFHETMKLKENIYLLIRYAPAACRIRERPAGDDRSLRTVEPGSAADRLENIIDIRGLLRRAAGDVVAQMEQIAHLFNHSSYILRLLMPVFAGNPLLVRLLAEQEERVLVLWGERLENIFAEMFDGDVAAGYCTAGRSYLAGQWFAQALQMYKQALAADATCDEAVTRMVQLQTVVKENRELLGTG